MEKKMTNKEWLFSLSDKDLAALCLGGIRDYSCQDINSLLFIAEWLNEPYDEKLMRKVFPYLECWGTQE